MKLRFESILKKYMVFFLILTVCAAGFCGFFAKWAFRDGAHGMGFEAILDGTASRPAVHRQFLPHVVRFVADAIPEASKDKLKDKLNKSAALDKRYAQVQIPQKYVIEYYLMYVICICAFIAAIWVLRALLTEILQDSVVGTLGAVFFALIFPYFEVLGGYFFDFTEILFFFLAARFALHGNGMGLLILAPFAEWNKESFFFFLPTLYPLLRCHHSTRKAASFILISMFFSGLVYLGILQAYAGNHGGMTEMHAWDHLKLMFSPLAYFKTTSIYGIPLGSGMFLPHMLCVALIAKKTWHYLSTPWKTHAKIALVLDGILYFFFVVPDEIRDLSMLYVTLMILTAYFFRDLLQQHGWQKVQQ